MIDLNKFVGIPWQCGGATMNAADCWGIVSLVYKEFKNIDLEQFEIDEISGSDNTRTMIEKVRKNNNKWVRTIAPRPLDVVVMYDKKTKRPDHVGVLVDNHHLLHSLTRYTGSSEIHKLKLIEKLFYKIEFFYYAS